MSSFQIKHIRLGIYQGCNMIEGVDGASIVSLMWFPFTLGTERMGFFEFENFESAADAINEMMQMNIPDMKQYDMIIEPYNKDLSIKLRMIRRELVEGRMLLN